MEPRRPEPGERIVSGDALDVTLLADDERLGAAVVRAAPGRPGPPAHVHRSHAECLVVLGGTLRAVLDGHEVPAAAGAVVLVPPGTAHTLAIEGDDDLRFLDLHAPGCGYGTFVRDLHAARDDEERAAARRRFDRSPPGPGEGGGRRALVCPPGGGETITDRPGRRVTLLADVPELAVSDSLYAPGERGPGLHVHREHADAFLVLAGALTFTLREGGLRAEAGTFVLVPPRVAHAFANEGPGDARFLNVHAPSCGFGDYLRGRNPGFDQHDPPADGGAHPAAVVARTVAA